jgi:ABC-type transport system substrate-binding protein
MISIRKGDADIVEAVSPNFHTWLEDQPNVRVQSGPTSSVLFLTPNNERPPFGDPRVRQAISMAINRPEIIQNILRGRARLLHGSLPDDILGCDLSIPFPTFDPEGARSLLSAAGVKKGHPITFTRVADNASPSATALAIQSYLRAVDLDVEIRQINAAARSKILAGDFDLTMQSVTLDFPDPWIMMNFAYGARAIGATNMSRYSNPEMEAVIAKADELDGEERAALYRRAQNIVHADLPTIPLFQDEWSFAVRSDIGGINYNFSQPMYFNFKDMKRQSV